MIGSSLPLRASLSGKIIRNVLSSGVRALVMAPVPFVMTPLILRKIGPNGYGVWAVFVAFSGLVSLADLGMVGTVSKHVAEYYTRGDTNALNRLFSTGLLIFGLLSCSVVVALWFGSGTITRTLLRGSALPVRDVVVLLKYFTLVIGANILTLFLLSVTSGLQRLDISNWISTANVLGAALIGGILLVRGWGLKGLVLGQACSAVLTVASAVVVANRLLPNVRIGVNHINFVEAKKMFSFSLRLYLTQAAVAVHNHWEKFLLASFVGVTAAGWYDIASDTALKLRSAIALVLGPMLPAASELDALNDKERTAELYYRVQKYLAFIGIPIGCYVSVAAVPFVKLWIGPNLLFVAAPLTTLLWVNFYNLLTGPGFLIFAGCGLLTPGVKSAALGLVSNVFLSLGLIYWFGFAGAVVGTSLSLLLASTYFIYIFHARTNYSLSRLFSEAYAKPIIVAVGLSVPLWLGLRETVPSWLKLAGFGLIFAVLYLAGILLSRFFDRYEWTKIEMLVPVARYARRLIPVA